MAKEIIEMEPVCPVHGRISTDAIDYDPSGVYTHKDCGEEIFYSRKE